MAKNTPNPNMAEDKTLFYTDLMFMPQDQKQSAVWMAQALFWAKRNSEQFEKTDRINSQRKLANGIINEQAYKEVIDPVTPMGAGGKAEYFASRFKDVPISLHLDNIIRARLDKILLQNQLQVSEIDKFSKSQRQKDKDRIKYQHVFRDLINEVNQQAGNPFPPISASESPYEYVNKVMGKDSKNGVDDMARMMEQIKLQIRDAQDFALYERYVYKGDIERAFELAIQHYLINQNTWAVTSERLIDDLKNFNLFCSEYYTDRLTGRKKMHYISPDQLYTSGFKDYIGDDITHYFYESNVTFADFFRMFGTTLRPDQLRAVFDHNKATGVSGGGHGLDWNDSWKNSRKHSDATIRIGKFCILAQEAESYVVSLENGIETMKHISGFEKIEDSATEKHKVYNVWYSCHYIPYTKGYNEESNDIVGWQWQADYIFNIQKELDMYRYGADGRYVKPPLVIYRDPRPSFLDVKEAFMPNIRTMWHKFENHITQDFTATVTDWDFLFAVLNAADESPKTALGDPDKPKGSNGVDAGMKQWKMMKQGGFSLMKFRNKNGDIPEGLDPSKFFVRVDPGHLEKAEKILPLMLQQYELLKIALSQSDVSEGQQAQPRTPVEGIKASMQASSDAMWFIEKPARQMLVMFGERQVQHILCILKEKKKYNEDARWKEFSEVIGLANALMIEGIEDLNPEEIGLTVSLEDVQGMKDYVFQMANEMVKTREVSREAAALAMEANRSNYKYAIALLLLDAKRQERENAAKEQVAFEQQMALQQKQLQIAMTLRQDKTQGNIQETQAEGQVKSLLQTQLNAEKNQTLSEQQSIRLQAKLTENQQQSDLDKEKEAQAPFIPSRPTELDEVEDKKK